MTHGPADVIKARQPPPYSAVKHLDTDPRYIPYIRHDQYGHQGSDPQPPGEMARLILMTIVVLPIRLIVAFLCMVACNATCRLSELLPGKTGRRICHASGKFLGSAMLLGMGFWVRWIKVRRDTSYSKRRCRRCKRQVHGCSPVLPEKITRA
jgi:hypothetical protein